MLGASLFRIGVGAVPFLLPLMLQLSFGLTPFQAGMLTFSTAAGALVMKASAARPRPQGRQVSVPSAMVCPRSISEGTALQGKNGECPGPPKLSS